MIVLVMGARSLKPLEIRLRKAKKLVCTRVKRIYLLGNDDWPVSALFEYTVIPGNSTLTTLVNFKECVHAPQQQIVIVSAWYHLPRCWLIARKLGFRHVQLKPSTWKIWETKLKTIKNEIKSLTHYFLGTTQNLHF